MDLESIILSEISQRQTAWLHVCIESKKQMNEQKQTHTEPMVGVRGQKEP